MASPLVWKVFDGTGRTMVASTMYAEDAALVVANTLNGIVKVDGRVVWREGKEEHFAGTSYDYAAGVMTKRRREHHAERYARLTQRQRSARIDTLANLRANNLEPRS